MAFTMGSLFFLLAVGAELSTKEGVNSRPVVCSIKRDYDGVLAVDQGEQSGPIFQGCSESFEDKHGSVPECKLNIAQIMANTLTSNVLCNSV
uniref:Uncharacterized protein n=1 Tax=Romanomermis culicivorax TaxID=13658 RepID=A0A915IJ14_ROMCU